MRIDLLYSENCPHYGPMLERLRDLIQRTGTEATIETHQVASLEHAIEARFLGSPTVRIDGVDVDPGAETRTDFGLKCRLYETRDGLAGMPPDEWILTTLRRPTHAEAPDAR